MNVIKFSNFNVNNEHMITRIGQYLGWGNITNIPREYNLECPYGGDYVFNIDYLDGYDQLALIKECLDCGLKIELQKVDKGE